MIAAVDKRGIRRSAERLQVEWPVRWFLETGGEWNDGYLLDVSRFGAYLAFDRASCRPSWGSSVAIHATFDSDAVLVEGRIRWIHGECGLGIAFLPEEGELAEALLWELYERRHPNVEVSGTFRRPF